MPDVGESAWTRLRGVWASGDAISGTVVDVREGGLIVDVGAQAFLPAKLLGVGDGNGDEARPSSYRVGQSLVVRVSEVQEGTRNLVVSRYALSEDA